ncbi:MAG: hypothetical protein KGJ02_02920 [Verrucomicrobiota bacterium]|nr:hypothetical protein [Verrucomicrobiota bacterium]
MSVKTALLRPFTSILLSRPAWGRPRQMDRGGFATTRKWPQNHRFSRAKQFLQLPLLLLAHLFEKLFGDRSPIVDDDNRKIFIKLRG